MTQLGYKVSELYTLKMESWGFSETLVSIHQTKRRHTA